jgi:hypothetical protein
MSDQPERTEIRKSKLESRGEFRISSFDSCLAVARHLPLALLGCHREERAKLLLNLFAFAFGASNPLLIVICYGQNQGKGLLALFARVFVAGHR